MPPNFSTASKRWCKWCKSPLAYASASITLCPHCDLPCARAGTGRCEKCQLMTAMDR